MQHYSGQLFVNSLSLLSSNTFTIWICIIPSLSCSNPMGGVWGYLCYGSTQWEVYIQPAYPSETGLKSGMLLEIAVIIGSLVQLGILYHCRHFKGQMPIMANSLKSATEELNDNANNALSILEDMIEILDNQQDGGSIITQPNPTTGESIMGMLTNQVLSNIMSPVTHGSETEIPTQNENTQETEVGN